MFLAKTTLDRAKTMTDLYSQFNFPPENALSSFFPNFSNIRMTPYIAESTYVSSKSRNHQISQNYYTAPALSFLGGSHPNIGKILKK